MNLIELLINGISYSQTQNGAYALILSEIEGERKLPIVIGTNEAQSIAIAIEKEIKPPRPLTHDLFKNFCVRFDIKIKQGCNIIIFSRLFRTSDPNKKGYLGIQKFNIIIYYIFQNKLNSKPTPTLIVFNRTINSASTFIKFISKINF